MLQIYKYTDHKKHVTDAELELQIAIDRVTAAATGTATATIEIVLMKGMMSCSIILLLNNFRCHLSF